MTSTNTDVLIVGAGPVGLSLAIELGTRGISVVVIERNARGGVAPRAKTLNVRSRTHLRRWGIAGRVAAASPLGIDYPADVRFVTSLAGFPLAHFPNMANMSPQRSQLYPEHAQWIPQYLLEKILLEHASGLPGVLVQFNTALSDATQFADGVKAVILDEGGTPRSVEARYLVGADGARSTTRSIIGARMEGRAGLSSHYNIVFRAPGLDRAHRHGPANMYWQIGSRGVTIVAPLDNGDLWAFGTSGVSESAMLSETQAIELIAATTGIDLPYEILQTDRWTASELLADKYQEGNIFIAGDAAHLHPPFGGFGMNMGIGDAVDLGWKIAATLQGWGGKRLLPSYEAERRPMAKAVIGEAMQNYAGMGKPPPLPAELADDSPQGEAVRARIGAVLRQSRAREFYTLGTVLGLPYTESPVIVGATQGAAQPHDGQNYVPNAAPGSLAPHAWLEDGRSLYDLFGSGFALLVQQGALEADIDAAEEDARRIGAPLAVVRLSTLSLDATYREPLYLIRPDQHVAWHGPRWSGAIFQAAGWPPDHEFKSNHGHRKDLRC